MGFVPFPNLINLELSDGWRLPSINTHLGLEVPVNRRSSLSFTAGYSFFFEERQDFEGASFTMNWNHYFRRNTRKRSAH